MPSKSLSGSVRVMALPVASTSVVPPMVSGPVWPTSPVLVTSRLPVTVVAPKVVLPPFVVSVWRSLPVPVTSPLTTRSPPALSTVSPVVCNTTVTLSLSVSCVAPPVRVTVPSKSLSGSVSTMSPVVVTLVSPVTVREPSWVTSPLASMVRVPPMSLGRWVITCTPPPLMSRLTFLTGVGSSTRVGSTALSLRSDRSRQLPLLAVLKTILLPNRLA